MRKKINDVINLLSRKIGINLYDWTKGGLFVGLPLILNSLFAVLISIIFTRIISQSIFGEYQFFLVILSMFFLFSLPEMDTALIRSVAKKHDKSFDKAIKIRFLWSLIGSAILFGVCLYLKSINQVAWKYYFYSALFFPFFYSFRSAFSFLIGKQKFSLYSKYFSSHIILVNLLFITIICLFKNLNIIILAYLAVNSLSFFIFYKIIRKKFLKKIKKTKEDKGLFKFGFHLTSISIIPMLFARADKIILTSFLGFEALAIYVIASSFPSQIRLITKPFVKMLLPKLSASKDAEKTFKFIRSKLIYIILVPAFIISTGALLIPYVIKILFPSSYLISIPYAQLLFFAYLLTFSTHMFNQFLISQKKTKSLFKISLITNIANILFLFLLIPFLNLLGVVLSKIFTNYLIFGLNFYYSWKESKI